MRFKTPEHIEIAYLRGTSALKYGSVSSFASSVSTQSSKCLLIFVSVSPSGLQLEHPLSGRVNQLSWYQKKPIPNGGNHGLGLGLIQYFLFEKIHEIVSKHQQLKPCLTGRQAGTVSRIAVRNHLVQTKTVNTFLDEVLTAGPLVVETPDSSGTFPLFVTIT